MIEIRHIDLLGDFRIENARDRSAAETTALFVTSRGHQAFGRDPASDHLAASAIVVSKDRSHTLLMHHAKLDRWLQPGGHLDGEHDVAAAALREAREETGLTSLKLVSRDILDIDIHVVPARPQEPSHLHYDIRFLIEADMNEPLAPNAEAKSLAWVPMSEIHRWTTAASIFRALARQDLVLTTAE